MKRFLVLGGGFAGVEAAIKLRKKGYEVTLVSDREYQFIYPISIWIPVKGVSFDDCKLSLADLREKHGFDLIIDKVEKIDAENRKVKLQNSELSYDYLFIALGMHKVKTKGIENTLSICGTPEQSVVIGEELDKLVAKGKGKIAIGFSGNPKDPTGSVVRGGPAFELLFNISTYLKKKGLLNSFELNFFAPMAQPGKKMGEKAFASLGKFFKHYRINKHVGKKIVGFNKGEILFEGDKKLESDLTVFIAGGSGHAVLKDSGLPLNEAGFINTLPTCQVEGYPEVYAIGDSAHILGPAWAAKQGHIAEIMADVASYNAHQQIIGSGKTKSYVDKVSIVCVMDSGDGAAFVSRTTKKETMVMLPIIGHWLKKAWGFYYINSKLKRIPRIPGM
ncbi:MAG: FAD-dependent oxidoreductase, partial [Cyclobacteriaceae bacterium]|nr:FAD-dependent oxidoreductase [Cyclobacteriaceae bacterium]MCK5368738.1 FAD-dependent oxidoreductase [Cyclobacteriaceae bacterium]